MVTEKKDIVDSLFYLEYRVYWQIGSKIIIGTGLLIGSAHSPQNKCTLSKKNQICTFSATKVQIQTV